MLFSYSLTGATCIFVSSLLCRFLVCGFCVFSLFSSWEPGTLERTEGQEKGFVIVPFISQVGVFFILLSFPCFRRIVIERDNVIRGDDGGREIRESHSLMIARHLSCLFLVRVCVFCLLSYF